MKGLNDILSHSISKGDRRDENLGNKNNKIRALSPECAEQLDSIKDVKTK